MNNIFVVHSDGVQSQPIKLELLVSTTDPSVLSVSYINPPDVCIKQNI